MSSESVVFIFAPSLEQYLRNVEITHRPNSWKRNQVGGGRFFPFYEEQKGLEGTMGLFS
jgi:hypothetical protein